MDDVVFTSSDARLKNDIQAARYGLEQLLKFRPVTFKWNNRESDGTQLGLIAQEVQTVVPEVVNTDANSGMLSVNYIALLPVAIRAIQQQQEVIKAQEARIVALEHPHKAAMSRLFSDGMGSAMALGLLPFALLFKVRRRLQRRNS